jgi:hypothetical protein
MTTSTTLRPERVQCLRVGHDPERCRFGGLAGGLHGCRAYTREERHVLHAEGYGRPLTVDERIALERSTAPLRNRLALSLMADNDMAPWELPTLMLDGIQYDASRGQAWAEADRGHFWHPTGAVAIYVPDVAMPAPRSRRRALDGSPWSPEQMRRYGPTAGARMVTLSFSTRELLREYIERERPQTVDPPELLLTLSPPHRALTAWEAYRAACSVGFDVPDPWHRTAPPGYIPVDALRCRRTLEVDGMAFGRLPWLRHARHLLDAREVGLARLSPAERERRLRVERANLDAERVADERRQRVGNAGRVLRIACATELAAAA